MRGGDKGEARKKVGSLKSSLMAQILLWRALNKYLVMWGCRILGGSNLLKGRFGLRYSTGIFILQDALIPCAPS